MTSLWDSIDFQEWEMVLARYQEAIAKKKDKFKSLDSWYIDCFATMIKNRSPPCISKEDYVQLVDWKLHRGKWRPRLLSYAEAQDPNVVSKVSADALGILDLSLNAATSVQDFSPALLARFRASAQKLCTLKGMGPATASALLAAVCPAAPFMSDEALEAALGVKDYTLPVWERLVTELNKKAASLSTSSGRSWTAVEVERCLWVATLLNYSKVPSKNDKSASHKKDAEKSTPHAMKRRRK